MYAIKETLLSGSLINNVSKEENRTEPFYPRYNKDSIEQFKEEMKNFELKKNESNFNQQVDSYKVETQNDYKQVVNANVVQNEDNYNQDANDFKVESQNSYIQIENEDNAESKNVFSEELSDYKNENMNDFDGQANESSNVNKETVSQEVNISNTEIENNKDEEDKKDYMKDNLYYFNDLNKLQTEILKEIEEMPVILDEKEVNEIEEIRNKIYSSRGQEIPEKDVKVNIVKNNVQNENSVVKEENYEPQNFEDMYEKTFGTPPSSARKKEIKFENLQYVETDNLSMFTKNEQYKGYKYIGTVFSTYIILEVDEEMYILDQHAAHERIMYEKVKENYYNGAKDCQMMLLPDVVNLTHKEWCILRENEEVFEKAGFKYEEFGDNTVKLIGVPSLCMEMDTKSLFLDILDEIDNVARTERQEIEERFIATVACKAAVKANMHLEFEEVTTLLDTLMKLPNPFTCPHGRPTAIKMTKSDIEKKFSRR